MTGITTPLLAVGIPGSITVIQKFLPTALQPISRPFPAKMKYNAGMYRLLQDVCAFLRCLNTIRTKMLDNWAGWSRWILDNIGLLDYCPNSNLLYCRCFLVTAQVAQGPLCGPFLNTPQDHVVCPRKRPSHQIQRPSSGFCALPF